MILFPLRNLKAERKYSKIRNVYMFTLVKYLMINVFLSISLSISLSICVCVCVFVCVCTGRSKCCNTHILDLYIGLTCPKADTEIWMSFSCFSCWGIVCLCLYLLGSMVYQALLVIYRQIYFLIKFFNQIYFFNQISNLPRSYKQR